MVQFVSSSEPDSIRSPQAADSAQSPSQYDYNSDKSNETKSFISNTIIIKQDFVPSAQSHSSEIFKSPTEPKTRRFNENLDTKSGPSIYMGRQIGIKSSCMMMRPDSHGMSHNDSFFNSFFILHGFCVGFYAF